jgi:hypothetical protein
MNRARNSPPTGIRYREYFPHSRHFFNNKSESRPLQGTMTLSITMLLRSQERDGAADTADVSIRKRRTAGLVSDGIAGEFPCAERRVVAI